MDRRDLPSRAFTCRLAALAVVAALLSGCLYNGHYSYGATEKFVHSDMNVLPKAIGVPIVAIVDGIISPFTAACDVYDDQPYSPDHRYLSYAGCRVIGRSDMALGYQWEASVPAIVLETVWLIVTGPIDLFTVLFDKTGRQDDD
ncbi:MAG TPA: hypothetical protein VFY71_06390 [Planctomycetota bacterium]|nr:hypothetical protein [Planctomycetota bacterium]